MNNIYGVGTEHVVDNFHLLRRLDSHGPRRDPVEVVVGDGELVSVVDDQTRERDVCELAVGDDDFLHFVGPDL